MTPRSIDEARTGAPHLGFAVYALEPAGTVTLEILDDGQSFTFVGATEAEAWERAFPGPAVSPIAAAIDRIEPEAPAPVEEPTESLFD